ncbi:hypothetical protein ASPVEDRAFT_47061 [Aspergillus versicolor CBS 583.65]|uniref:Cytochrome P450 monooxygenase n=1 Tax=Aspergillus versicolor CBS 583.65 TaxID=1036611 RepID=A0A1L9Q261_ASPVE|nr:uncharacterized protein ASPVEDRAFT_47061 [Aspergillus versicolor CBS 583.65]OJJ07867.1 hypothetical protein ASPVEDRAFT_47061 [Aspergillus versicolor CBS 583.65]
MDPSFYLAAGIAGVATHLLYFHNGEHHLYPQRYLQALLLLSLTVAGLFKYVAKVATADAISLSARLTTVYVAGIYLSVVIYRLFFNPLNKYPGRLLARLTAFDQVFRVAKNKDMFLKLYDAHQKLGNFVRIGPNDLSVADADAVRVAFSAQTTCSKAPWYSIELPAYSMHSTRSRADHDKRRRIWSPAFSDKALRGYEQRVLKYNKSLLERLSSFDGQTVNASRWFNLWSFDVMGDLAFGRSFDMLASKSQEEHWAIQILNNAQDKAGLAFPPWLNRLLWHVPGIRKSYFRFLNYCAEMIEQRMLVQGKQQNPDITHYLIEDFNKRSTEDQKVEIHSLHLDSKLIIVAGSDTTAATLTYMFFHLATEEGLLARLRQEIEPLLGENGEIEHRDLQNAQLLNGCINETLRLHPPVPSGLYRKTPPEGVQIGQEYIPGNTTLQIHLYSIGRSENHFTQANDFIPERFFSRPELIKHKDAFSPFSMGPYGCIGKNLAYMQIRLLTAYLITKFDVRLAPGEDGQDLLLRSADHFTTGLAPLNLCFIKRD